MLVHDPHKLTQAAEEIAALLPSPASDEVSISTLTRNVGELVLLVMIPPALAHIRHRLPSSVRGVQVLYEIQEPYTLN